MFRSADIRFYYPKHDGAADGEAPTTLTVDATTTALDIICNELTEANDFYNDAILRGLTGNLAGVYAHIRDWVLATTDLTLARELASIPAVGNTFQLMLMGAGSQYRSNLEVPGMDSTAIGTGAGELNASGVFVTVKKVGYLCGAGTANIAWNDTGDTLALTAPDDSNPGEAVDISAGDGDYVLYGEDEDKWIEVTVDYSEATVGDADSDITLAVPSALWLPHIEGYQSGSLFTRYGLLPFKNNNAADAATDCKMYLTARAGTASTVASGTLGSAAGTLVGTDCADWPTRDFWAYNTDLSDIRYVKYRSANTLYFAARGAGAERRGATNTADWNAADVISIYPDIDIADAGPTGSVYPADLSALSYSAPTAYASGVDLGTIAASAIDGIAYRETVLDVMYPLDDIVASIRWGAW